MKTDLLEMKKKKKKGRKPIPDRIKLKLWTKSGGRCQFNGCNEYLLTDELTYAEINNAHIAHIIDVNKKTHRHTDDYMEDEKNEFWNLMLLCQKHHRLIDNEEELNYSVDRLQKMKKAHEDRIFHLTSIKNDVKTNIILYTSKIGKFEPVVGFEEIKNVLAKNNLYPTIEPYNLGIKGGAIEDNDSLYWEYEERSLVDNFEKNIAKHFGSTENKHFSLFGLAPQPLLIKLGTLIPDLYAVDVYQKHREPNTWEWQEDKGFSDYKIIEPTKIDGEPILIISLSANIDRERITEVINGKHSIWELTIDEPNLHYLKTPEILQKFRIAVRSVFNKVKKMHGHNAVLKVFPCMPNSASIEFGRVWMPKADLTMDIYDERDGFKKAITIKRN